MTRVLVENTVEETKSSGTVTASPIADPVAMESPKLTRIHEATNAIIDRLLKRDPKRFQELSRTQQSGQ